MTVMKVTWKFQIYTDKKVDEGHNNKIYQVDNTETNDVPYNWSIQYLYIIFTGWNKEI